MGKHANLVMVLVDFHCCDGMSDGNWLWKERFSFVHVSENAVNDFRERSPSL